MFTVDEPVLTDPARMSAQQRERLAALEALVCERAAVAAAGLVAGHR